MAKPAETKGKALKAFELTWVMYDPTDRFGVLMALFTLSPVYDWFIATRDDQGSPLTLTSALINLVVRAFDAGFTRLLLLRLKECFVVLDDGLEMRTSIYVQNKKVFCECMEWKRKEIEKKWREHDDMAPAAD